MSKIISYKGTLDIGTENRIRLKTIKGKIGYKINKFQIMSTTPGTNNVELIGQIFKTSQIGSIGTSVQFTNADLLAAVFYDRASNRSTQTIIFDNEKVNQDIFVNITDQSGNTIPANYYIELETMYLSDLESTQMTLKSLRTIASQ
jgi:hypothetical protein